ncbi:COG1361 S-layer family protein [Haloarcula marina]|uniref:COG1361 S-layer family protein n=1 Tax=Haloarcula marina TaxID=2961574 RepID=UPI0020B646AC|nr:hypothetical protein [Halomicroarcula marina]
MNRSLALALAALLLCSPVAAGSDGFVSHAREQRWDTSASLTSGGTPGFELEDVDTDLQVGEDGTLSLDIENYDLGNLTDATVVLRSTNPEISVGTRNGSRFVGDWENNDTETVEFAVSASEAAREQEYPLTAVVRYTDPNGNATQSAPITFGIEPDRRQRFKLTDVDGSLRAGADGEIDVTVKNKGPRDVEDAVLLVRETADGVTPLKSEVALGEFEDGEKETVELPFRVDRSVPASKRQFEFAVGYTTEDGVRREGGPLFGKVKIRDREDIVSVEDVDVDARIGERGTVRVTLENEGDDDLRDARVTFSSLDSAVRFGEARNTSRFVDEWEGGDEETFELPTRFSADASTDEYPIAVRVRYLDEDGNPQVADDVQFGVEPDDAQEFDLDDVEGDLRVGADGTVEGTVTNDGPDDVSDAVLVVQSTPEGVTALQQRIPLREFDDGEDEDFSLPVRVADDAEPTERQFEFAVQYTNDDGERLTSDPLFATVEIREEAEVFVVEDVTTDSQVGDRGTVTVTLRNDGDEDLTDAGVSFSSRDPSFRLGGSLNTTRYVAEWDAGEEVTFELPTRFSADAVTDEYPVFVRVDYTDADGDERVADDVRFGVTPVEEQQFDIDNPEGQLQVGRDGTVEGDIENTGPQDTSSAVLRVITPNDDVVALESEYVLGDFDEGDRRSFEFPVRVLDSARPGAKQFEFVVEYRNDEGDVIESRRLAAEYEVFAEAGQFRVTDLDSDVQVGEDGTAALTLRYTGDEELTNAVVQLQSVGGELTVGAVDRPNGSRAVGEWDPGERRTVTFRVSAPENAAPQAYPFDVRVAYEDEDGDAQQSEPIALAIVPAPEQEFSLGNVAGDLEVGAERDLTGRVVNDGPRPVGDVVVELTSTSDSLSPQEREYAIGDLGRNDSARFRLPVRVPADAEAIPRQVQFVVRYSNADGDRRESGVLPARLPVAAERDTFRVVDVAQSVQAGDDGNVTVTLENAGEERVGRTLVSLRSQSGELRVGEGVNATRFVASLRPGERRTVTFRVSAPEDAGGQRYPLRLRVGYEDASGDSQPSETQTIGVVAAGDQSFAVENVSGTLRVGAEGTVRATIRNRGPNPVTEAFASLAVGSENLVVQENESRLGRLEPGERAGVSFPVEVLDETEPGDRRVSFVVQYQNVEDESRRSDPLPRGVAVAERRPVFVVRPGNTTVDAGGSEVITLEVTNNGDAVLSNVDAKVFVNDPLSADDDQAFVSRLRPGQTVELAFSVSASGGATTKDYPLSVDFQYEEPDGETKLSETYRVPVAVQEPSGDGLPILLLLVGLLVLAAVVAAVVLYRRRRRRAGETTDATPSETDSSGG